MKLYSLIKSRTDEGLRPNDLQHLILNKVSIDEFEPKSGDSSEILVMGLYAKDEEPARDLSRFIERGYIDVIDTEVSPGPDEDGNYMVFVEIDKNKNTMKTVSEVLHDIKTITAVTEWNLNFYKGGSHSLTEEMIKKAIRG
jgi:hypothetical protein|tara:strand:+ start:6139 stop:6561 length:423 start_codon:yes stop_codon:yes gene_type:complete